MRDGAFQTLKAPLISPAMLAVQLLSYQVVFPVDGSVLRVPVLLDDVESVLDDLDTLYQHLKLAVSRKGTNRRRVRRSGGRKRTLRRTSRHRGADSEEG